MDGLLSDTEPLWREAEKQTFLKVGIALTDAMCMQTMGWRTNEVISYWHQQHPWDNISLEEVEEDLLTGVQQLMSEKATAMPGVYDTLELAKKESLKIALASSSPFRLINTIVDKLEIRDYFSVICSAQDDQYGKPHPGVFIRTADALGVAPMDCLVFEDSFYGVIAGIAAKTTVVAVPDPHDFNAQKWCVANRKIRSLTEFDSFLVSG